MVALLWENGDVAAAIELESLWNELARTHRFSLYYAYPMASLVSHGDVMATSKVCEHHSDVLAPRSYESRPTSPTGSDDPEERSQLFVPVMSAVAAARRFVRETLVAWHEADLVDDATLVASELATNAVRHAGSAFRLTIVRTDSGLRIAVQDISPQEPSRRDPSSSVPGGRGPRSSSCCACAGAANRESTAKWSGPSSRCEESTRSWCGSAEQVALAEGAAERRSARVGRGARCLWRSRRCPCLGPVR